MMLYLNLLITFLKIGLFGFGGGYAIAALIQNEVVDVHHWMTVEEFTNIMAISQTTPGPIAINCATYVGYSATQSIWGAALATIAVCIPPIIIMGLICIYLNKFKENRFVKYAFWGLKPIVVGLIASAALMLANSENFIDISSYIIFILVAALSIMKVNPIILICLSGIAGYFLYV